MLVPTLKSLVETVPARTVRTPRDAGVALGVGKKRGWVSLVRVRFHGTSAARRYDDDVGCGGGKGAGGRAGGAGAHLRTTAGRKTATLATEAAKEAIVLGFEVSDGAARW